MFEKEEILHGGNVNNVVRIGNTVRRSTSWSFFVHELLRYLEKQGFDGAPRFIGIDDKGREILSYIEGEVSGNDYPDFKPYIWSEDSLIRCAKLLRQYHDATQGFLETADIPKADYKGPVPEGWENEVVCHNDAALYNIVFKDEVPVAFIDFDLVKPGPRIWDIVYMLYTSVPLASFAINYNSGKSIPYKPELHAADRYNRISLFLKSYGMEAPLKLKEWTISRIEVLCNTLTTGALSGNTAYQKMIDEGHLEHYKREIIFLKEHFNDWLK